MLIKRTKLIYLAVAGLVLAAGCGGPQGSPPRTVIRVSATPGGATIVRTATPSASGSSTTNSGGTVASPVPQAQPSPTTANASSSATEPAGEKITLDLVKTLSTVEQVDEIRELLHETPGILGVSGNEISLTFIYDPAIISVQGILDKMEALGHELKAP